MGYRWRPYSGGHWLWTDYGRTWISDQEGGDMPFHNGRWGWDNDIGILMAMGATPLKWPKVNRDDAAKLSDLKKNHAFERQVKTDRHHNDAERVKKVKQACARHL
jgi:hypothetical protein